MNPKISVCVVTYNHEKYIRQCLQSVVDQEVNVELEIIVCDDCSTDKTREIINEFSLAYPAIIKPIFLEKNIGAFKNFIQTHNRACGEFVSHCDGDDYFLPNKLQAQFDYLSAHQDCAVTWHHMRIEQNGQHSLLSSPRSYLQQGIIDTSALLRMGSIGAHSSIMYRRSARITRDDNLKLLDFYYALEFLQSGYGYFIDQVFGVYRKVEAGTSMTSSRKGYVSTKTLLARHYSDFYARNKQYRKDIFVGVLFDFIYDVINFRKSSIAFFGVLVKTFSFFSILDVFKVLKIKLRLAQKMHTF
jgi:glycosyltransferase involved in cell wall biosynthesis